MDDEANEQAQPTGRELEILKVLWQRGEATVRQVYEAMSQEVPIVQNTVQAFLRTMEQKGLVEHRTEGRTFIYRPAVEREPTQRTLVSRLLARAFDGAVDQLVASVLSLREPTTQEINELQKLLENARKSANKRGRGT